MRKTILAILMSIALIGCSKTLNEDVRQVETDNVLTEFAELIGNDLANPLLNTVWEYKMDGEYNLYLWFWSDTNLSAFYGIVEDGVLERWSPLYGWDSSLEYVKDSFGGGPYRYEDGNLTIALRFPMWGDNKTVTTITAGKAEKQFTLSCGDMTFTYQGLGNAEELEGMWVSIFVGISPWG